MFTVLGDTHTAPHSEPRDAEGCSLATSVPIGKQLNPFPEGFSESRLPPPPFLRLKPRLYHPHFEQCMLKALRLPVVSDYSSEVSQTLQGEERVPEDRRWSAGSHSAAGGGFFQDGRH